MSNVPSIIPQMPPPFVIPTQTTAVQAVNLKDVFDREFKQFYIVKVRSLVQAIRAQLINQIDETVEKQCLSSLFNDQKARIQGEIWEILGYLKNKKILINLLIMN